MDDNASVSDRQTTLSMTVLMTPDMANFSGNVHGGSVLKILDQVAFACASTYARSYVVTLSVDRVLFREAIHVGDLVIPARAAPEWAISGMPSHTLASMFTIAPPLDFMNCPCTSRDTKNPPVRLVARTESHPFLLTPQPASETGHRHC